MAPVVIEQLAQFLHRVADVGAQHVLTVELVIHLPDRALQERHAAGVAGTECQEYDPSSA